MAAAKPAQKNFVKLAHIVSLFIKHKLSEIQKSYLVNERFPSQYFLLVELFFCRVPERDKKTKPPSSKLSLLNPSFKTVAPHPLLSRLRCLFVLSSPFSR